jgi:hypothetical protein
MPVIHVYRDPRTIVASIKMTPWGWELEHLSLREQLLEQRDGRTDFFSRYENEIREYDQKDTPARITAYWALAEKFLQQSYADNQSRVVFVSYEELYWKREKLLLDILRRLSVNHVPDEKFRVLAEDSASISRQRLRASADERISGWRKILSSFEIATTESITQHFGFDDRLVQDNEPIPRIGFGLEI